MPINRFNLRVYGVWIEEGRVLATEEYIRTMQVVKFPGGGLEFGEGLKDGLIREWKEELNLDIRVLEHFYTTDFFQPSAFNDSSQVVSVYYRVAAPTGSVIRNLVPGERSFWMPLNEVKPEAFTLPIDKVVAGLLREEQAALK